MTGTIMYLKGLRPNQSRISDVYDAITDILKGRKQKPPQIEDDFIFCNLCGCHHYKDCHIKQFEKDLGEKK